MHQEFFTCETLLELASLGGILLSGGPEQIESECCSHHCSCDHDMHHPNETLHQFLQQLLWSRDFCMLPAQARPQQDVVAVWHTSCFRKSATSSRSLRSNAL